MTKSSLGLVTVIASVVAAWVCAVAGWLEPLVAVTTIFTLSTAYCSWVFWDFKRDIGRVGAALDGIRRLDGVEALSEGEFYLRFRDSVKAAKHSVDICYLDSRPPAPPRGTPKAAYYRELPGLIRSQGTVEFRRLNLLSQHTAPWLVRMAQEMEGARNFSLRLVEEDSPRIGGAISVQCVDNVQAYLVAPGEQRPAGPHRDVLIRSARAAGLLRRYYERLWEAGKPLVDRGDLDRDFLDEVRGRLKSDARARGAGS